jgi:hypothetical protein
LIVVPAARHALDALEDWRGAAHRVDTRRPAGPAMTTTAPARSDDQVARGEAVEGHVREPAVEDRRAQTDTSAASSAP